MREVRFRGFRVGHCRHPQAMTIRGGTWRPVEFPALAMLLVHPAEGPILFDTGYDPAFFDATELFPERLYRWATPPKLEGDEDLASQLAAVGVRPSDIRHLVLSHFHADHMAGAHRFGKATIHCARAGHEAACSGSRLARTRRGMLSGLIPAGFAARARYFEDAARHALPRDALPFTDGADLLGDGSLLAVELPGHCPGHWGLLIREAAAGLHFLVADAAWSSEAIRRNAPPPTVTARLLGDAVRGRETLRSLHDLYCRNPEMRMTPSHCAECAERWTR